MTATVDDQCRALTESGKRCSRPAQEDGYCYQHGPEDGSVDEDHPDEATETKDQRIMTDGNNGTATIGEVREQVQQTAEGVVGHPLDGITSINHDDGDWRVAVEVIERKSVPDTQDILGRYEIRLDEDLTVTEYERTHRYRRDDMEHNV